jgi:hypothetical protein
VSVEGRQEHSDGTVRPLDRADLIAPLDGALRGLSVAVPLVAIAMLAVRL